MKRTSVAALLALGVLGGVGGYVLQRGLAAASLVRIRPEYTLSFSLVLIAALVVLLAVPIWQATHGPAAGRPRRRVDPFRATRVVLFAKASAYLGAGLSGVGAGFLVEVLTRPVLPEADAVLRVAAMAVASLLLLIAGLVAEHLCTVPPGEDDDAGGAPAG